METSSIQETIRTFHSRKLLDFPSFNNQSSASTSASLPPPPGSHDLSSFGSDVVMILTVLICAVICSHLLNAIIRCGLKFSRLVSSDDDSGNGNNSRPGKSNQGINKQALKTFPVVSYSGDLKIPGLETECVICLEDFSPGEKLRILTKCNHGFHVKCIDKWLNCHSSCPTCRHCLIETSQKIVGCTSPSQPRSNSSLPGRLQEIIVRIAPLEPEGMIQIVIVK